MSTTVKNAAASNGTVKATRKVKSKKVKPVIVGTAATWARRTITIGLGCGIPGLSLALSSIGGRLLLTGQAYLGIAALALCCSVLAVSLSHLAGAIKDITHSLDWQSWCLAVAVDSSLVLCELSGVVGFHHWAVAAVMVSVTVTSAALNCWAFLQHK
jgi:hypothetical protein